MKLAVVFISIFLLAISGSSAQTFASDSAKVSLALSHGKRISIEKIDTIYKKAIDSILSWTNHPIIERGKFIKNKSGKGYYAVRKKHENATTIVILPDSCMDLENKHIHLMAAPTIFDTTEQYVYIRESIVRKWTPENIFFGIAHELYHEYEYLENRKKYFPKAPDIKTKREAVIARESDAWAFESYIFFLLNPKYTKHLSLCKCKKTNFSLQVADLKRTLLAKKDGSYPDIVIYYFFARKCPRFLVENLGYIETLKE